MPDVTHFLDALWAHFKPENDAALGKILGLSSSKIPEWRKGRFRVTLVAIEKISKKTGLDQRVLLDWLEPRADQKSRPVRNSTKPRIRLVPKREDDRSTGAQ